MKRVIGNDVTRNRVTGFFSFFSSFNLLLLALFVCLPFLLFVFEVKKIVNIIRIWRGFSRLLAKFTAFVEALFPRAHFLRSVALCYRLRPGSPT